LYALVLTIDELRKFNCKSKTKQCRTPHEVYYIQLSLASDDSIVRCQEDFLYILHWRGTFDVARFDLQGNAKAYRSWNE